MGLSAGDWQEFCQYPASAPTFLEPLRRFRLLVAEAKKRISPGEDGQGLKDSASDGLGAGRANNLRFDGQGAPRDDNSRITQRGRVFVKSILNG